MAISEELKRAQIKIRLLERELDQVRQKENEFYRIIETLESHIFRCKKDEKGEIIPLFSEGKIARRYRMRTHQVQGKTLRDIMGEKPYSYLEPYYIRAFEGESVEFRGFLYGSRYFSVRVLPSQRDAAGRVVEVVGITQDITEIHIAQIESKRNSEVLNRIIEYNPYSIQILDAKGHHIRENKAFLELFKTLPDQNWSLLDDNQILGQGLNDLLIRVKNGEVVETPPVWYNAHLTNKKYPDHPICIGSVIFPVLLSSGQLEYIVLMHEDITARIMAEDALKASERRMKHLLASNPAVIYTSEITSPWDWTFISDNVSHLTGYDPKDFLENKGLWTKSIHPDDRERILKEIPLVFESGYHVMEYRFRCKNNKYIWILDEARIVFDSDGSPLELIGYWIDISSRKEADHQLLIAKEKAEESDRLKSAFLANMSHEIRTPMNGIMGFADLLKDPLLSDDERNEYIEIIRRSGNRLLNIINDLINISKIESGQMGVNISETNINVQLDFLFSFFETETKQKNINLSLVKPLSDIQSIVKTDKEKVYAILTNLIKNAIKFTDQGTIEFGYTPKEECIEFFVRDTGIGISPENQQSILERFIQVDSTFSASHEGAGLGLSICKAYVELLGGKLWVESEISKGSTFFFTVPYNTSSFIH
ncbi:ATP-binding protein [Thermophagus sp. OGC60D27]|uniref:ATP-binding protein n=1 Tax=Thermophagus sp. OGC60D27 TaxID=3458415 RepID=UPI00403772A5